MARDSTVRTREWRARRRQRPGGLAQVIAWVPRAYMEPLRKIFELLGDPDWQGQAYRQEVAHWLYRRRAAPHRLSGNSHAVEIDQPQVASDGSGSIPLGGRVFGPDGAFVELEPDEARVLNENLRRAIDQTTEQFLISRRLDRTLRDYAGVLPPEAAPHHLGYRPPDLKAYEVDRPESEAQFHTREVALVGAIAKVPRELESMAIEPGLHELRYAGTLDLPSRCLALVAAPRECDPSDAASTVALIGVLDGGTPPTLLYARLAEFVRKSFLSDHDQNKIRYFDVEPNEFSLTAALCISEVKYEGEEALTWQANPRISLGLNRRLRQSVETYDGWRRGRRPPRPLSEEEVDAVTMLGAFGDEA